MANSIRTNFCIGTEQDRKTMSFISKATAREKYKGKVPEAELEAWIEKSFNDPTLRAELNNISNQYLVVHVNDQIAGYARITTKGERPAFFDGSSVVRIADFAVLQKFDETEAKQRLFQKCLQLCNTQQTVWISEFESHPDLDFFTGYGFVKNPAITGANELGLPMVYLVKNL